MADQVNVGIIGTSWWADLIFLPIFSGYERANLAAICGRNQNRATEMATKYSVPQTFTDYRQMIDEGNLDAVVVSTPDDTHYEMIMAALDAGLHVLCEKPVALNTAHAKEMCEKAESAGVKHMVLYTWHWLPVMQRMKQLVDTGYIGSAYHGDFRWVEDYAHSGKYMWRFDADRSNGVVSDLGSHMIHFARWLMGDVASVSAHLGFHVNREGLDGRPAKPANDAATVTLEFTSGAQATVHVSAVALRPTTEFFLSFSCALYGKAGRLDSRISMLPDNDMRLRLRGRQDSIDDDKIIFDSTHLNLIDYFSSQPIGPRQFVDCILQDRAISPGLDEGYKVQQVINAAIQSHESGCRVAIES
jgi:predicted dehydrogenase